MVSFFDKMLGRPAKKTGSTAKERLQFVLVHDRINLPPEQLKMMKAEILAVISKYVKVDEDNVDIELQQGDRRGSLLVAEIPFRGTPGELARDADEDKPATAHVQSAANEDDEDDA
jgi:cell division topological specificity factor